MIDHVPTLDMMLVYGEVFLMEYVALSERQCKSELDL